jgi:riboflavin synthase
MFSGIIEETAIVKAIAHDRENVHLTLGCSFVNELKIDQSVSHNGVCLTVVGKTADMYTVTAIRETLERSNLGLLQIDDRVNVERSMRTNGRLDGHIVQGHVDQTAVCTEVREADGSRYFSFEYLFDQAMARQGYMTVEKGSICVNGVSLTVCNSKDNSFEVAIIPYTFEHTNFGQIKKGTVVNLEFDIVGKYISKLIRFQNSDSPPKTPIQSFSSLSEGL